jgi:Cd2+/Zn2+-exporting ATPase
VIGELHRSGIRRTVMLTGDHQMTAEKVARAVGSANITAVFFPKTRWPRSKNWPRPDRSA